jgi:hypothetical protein
MSTDPELIYDSATSDLSLNNLIAGRLYPAVLPPDPTLPAVTYHLVSQPTDFSQDGAEYRWPRWRFRIYSLIYADLVPIAKALAAIFGDQSRTPFTRSWIEYPASQAEGHETDTHRYWRAMDVVAFSVAGALAQ